jgi:hypothetical protein
VYLTNKLYFNIDENIVFIKNISSCLKNITTGTNIVQHIDNVFTRNLNQWTVLTYNLYNLFDNINDCVYNILTKNICTDVKFVEYFNKTNFYCKHQDWKFNIIECFITKLENMFENNFILSNVEYYLNYTNKKYDWHIIIPYCDRYENLIFLLCNLKSVINEKINIVISIVEISYKSSYDKLKLNQYDNVNYFWLDMKYTGGKFIKCLCANICNTLSQNYFTYDYILWHDVDCCVQSNFFIQTQEILREITKNNTIEFEHAIVPYPNKTVYRANKELSKLIRNDEIHVDNVEQYSDDIEPIIQGSPGGSLLIKTTLFEKIGMFNTSVFYGKCPEDNFILMLIKKYGYIYEVKMNNNKLIHLWHEI